MHRLWTSHGYGQIERLLNTRRVVCLGSNSIGIGLCKMTQLLHRLEAEIRVAQDPIARAEALAPKACSLSRLGRFDEARKLVQELRAVFGDGRSGRVTAWIMRAEGLIHWHSALSPLPLDRISRAQALSVAMSYSKVAAVAPAWIAQLEFENSNLGSMFASIRGAAKYIGDDNFEAHAGISMVAANGFAFCREHERL